MPRYDFGHLYFIRSMTLEAMKIGFAVDPEQRLSGIQTGNPHRLYISTVVPIQREAERALHDFLKPHRTHGEWYPDDTFMVCVESHLIEAWGDKVQDTNDGSHAAWGTDGDEWENPLGVHLNAADMRRELKKFVKGYFAMTDDDWDEDPPPPITNHWGPKPRPRNRRRWGINRPQTTA